MENIARSCKHCGTPVPQQRDDEFCCAGCAYVFDLLHTQGLDQFYDLKGGQSLPPVPAQAMRERDYEWLERLVAEEAGSDITLSLQGISCVGCVWLIEKLFARRPGAGRVRVDVMRGEVTLSWDRGVFDVIAFARELQGFGYLLGPRRTGDDAARQSDGLERRMGTCGALAMNAMAFSLPAYFGMPADFMFARWFDLVAAVSATLALLIGGSYFAERAWRGLRAGVLHIDTPIALGIIAAYVGSVGGWLAGVSALKYFDFVAIFIFLMLAGRWAQQAAVERNRRRLMRDTSISDTVTVFAEDGASVTKNVSALKAGERLLIKPAQVVPVASRLMSGGASVSLEWINGESEARPRAEGQLLPSGAMNIGGSDIEVEALETWERATLRKLLDARKEGDFRDLALERLLRWYLAIVIVVGVGGALWWWMNGAGVAAALQVMISVFVVSCPCALGVAAPLADDLAASRAEKIGVFARTLGLWKKLARVRQVAFDKTGTLTLENPALRDTTTIRKLTDEQRSALRALVSGNLHPVSRSLFDALGPGAVMQARGGIDEVIGHGMSFIDETGRLWSLGKSNAQDSDTEFACDGEAITSFSFRDELRAESVTEMQRLARRGVSSFVLSGDSAAKVSEIAAQLHLPHDHCFARMTPEQKAEWVRMRNADNLLFIGDGANDSLAFDAALCAGSPVTGRSFLEHKADFYFLGHSLRFVSSLLDVARLHRIAVRRVFAFSVTYNIATAIAGLAGHLNPLAAAILMPLSSVATMGVVALTFSQGKNHTSLSRVRSCVSTMPTGAPLSSTTTMSSTRALASVAKTSAASLSA